MLSEADIELLALPDWVNINKARDIAKLASMYEVPTAQKTGKDTTNQKDLERLARRTGDIVLSNVLAERSLSTVINNFIPNWAPHSDGNVHTKFNFTPPTGQLATRAPNVQNAGKHKETGRRFRRIVEAKPDHVLIEFDYQRFHVATMGHAANDPTYVRFAKLDSHSIFTSHLVSQPIDLAWSDADIKQACNEIKKYYKTVRDTKAKQTVLGNQLGLGARKLYWMNKEHISSVQEAEAMQAIIANLFPKVHSFKDAIREIAHKQTYLINNWGRIQYFFDVYHFFYNRKNREWVRRYGADSERAIAFLVQSNAHGVIADKILTLERKGFNEAYGFCNTIHDSIMFHVHKSKAKQAVRDIYPILIEPCKQLTNEACPDGLSVGVDISIGSNWQGKNDNNPHGMREVDYARFC